MDNSKSALNEEQMRLIKDKIEDPSLAAGISIFHQAADETANGYELSKSIKESIDCQTQKIKDNPVDAVIEMLSAQVAVLNASFHQLYSEATKQPNYQRMTVVMEMVLKCQEQARKTLKTISDIQNPKPKAVFIKNALIQQLNKLEDKTQELQQQLETQPYGQVEFRGKTKTERADEIIVDGRTSRTSKTED